MNNYKTFKNAEDTRRFLNDISIVHVKSSYFKDVIKYIARLQCPDG